MLHTSFAALARELAHPTSSCSPRSSCRPRRSRSRSASRALPKEKPERISWTKAEDETILRGVSEMGHKWNKIAERLPGRTDHAIRNRFHRLQTLLEDRQRQQQRVLAPDAPLPMPLGKGGSGVGLEDDGFQTPLGSAHAESPAGLVAMAP